MCGRAAFAGAAGALALALAMSAGASAGDEAARDSAASASLAAWAELGIDAAGVSDEDLGAIRGRYVPPGTAVAAAYGVETNRAAGVRDVTARAVASQPAPTALDLHGTGGQIVYFGLAVSTQWQIGTGPNATTYAAGVALSGAPGGGGVSTTTWSVKSGPDPGAPSAPNTIAGGLAPGTVGGVAQAIQIAGNGNSAANHATVDVGPGAPDVPAVPSGSPCGSACHVTIGGQGIGVSIATPGGLASQTVGAGSIAQNVQVVSDFNAVVNTLHLQVQTLSPAFSPAGLLSSLWQTHGLH
jgi:hypothetical protein